MVFEREHHPRGHGPNLVVANLQIINTGAYVVLVWDQLGVATNEPPAILGVRPQILTQPQSQTPAVGSTVTLSVSVVGTPPLLYGWMRNGRLLPGQTQSSLTLLNVQPTDAGIYRAIVSHQTPLGPAGTFSSNAVLTVR